MVPGGKAWRVGGPSAWTEKDSEGIAPGQGQGAETRTIASRGSLSVLGSRRTRPERLNPKKRPNGCRGEQFFRKHGDARDEKNAPYRNRAGGVGLSVRVGPKGLVSYWGGVYSE